MIRTTRYVLRGSLRTGEGLFDVTSKIIRLSCGYLWQYTIQDPPIVIFASRRSGSTLLMRMVYSQAATDYMSQPHLYQYSKDWVKKRYPFEYTDELEQYFSHLFRGDIRLWNQWNPLDESFNFRVHQIVYKLFKANHLVELLERNFRLRACGLVRHPLAVVNSTAEREWPEEAAPYLKSSLIRARLPDEALAVSERIYREGTYQSRLLVEWFLKNYWLFEQRSYPVVSYEDIVSYPFDASGWLCHYLNLGDQRTMSDVVESPTKTTTTPSAKDIREEGPSVRIGAWQHCLDTALIKQCRRLLEAYSIRRYRSDTVYPADGRLVTDQPGECDET